MLSETNAVLPIHFPLESVNTMEKKQHMLGLPGATFLFITWIVHRTEVLPSHAWLEGRAKTQT